MQRLCQEEQWFAAQENKLNHWLALAEETRTLRLYPTHTDIQAVDFIYVIFKVL